MMDFLYFPENKMEYIPALITLLIFSYGAFVAMKLIVKKAKREREQFESKYPEAKRESNEPRQ
ncbi:hypothetical protein [Tenuibacillus multivorans]|uniref:Uncharacterized protein n=1 Tax=Tenuibacillus multivorans TaxID=237069 RepID=A0A1H0FS21_9BACI|nr:hypothetical protein [Tenuibacillus multivorans]GEL77906.1 hypothetical protein TMU01_21410 [Tenuibacillus multivorans]SDN97463.1 hypothetical protein SAMN05216498_0339 [Tenuibacillus multivorans]